MSRCTPHGARYCLNVDCRTLERAGALVRTLDKFIAGLEHKRRAVWVTQSHLGAIGAGYRVTKRGAGYAVITRTSGATETLYAPTPLQ